MRERVTERGTEAQDKFCTFLGGDPIIRQKIVSAISFEAKLQIIFINRT